MSNGKVHIVCFNKTRPRPPWLADDSPQCHTHSYRYWRRIWDAQPSWADTDAIKAIYREAARLRAQGFDVEVDHIYPLRGDLVSGLHIPANMRIIPRRENSRRGNRVYPGQPFEQFDIFHQTHADGEFELKVQYGK